MRLDRFTPSRKVTPTVSAFIRHCSLCDARKYRIETAKGWVIFVCLECDKLPRNILPFKKG